MLLQHIFLIEHRAFAAHEQNRILIFHAAYGIWCHKLCTNLLVILAGRTMRTSGLRGRFGEDRFLAQPFGHIFVGRGIIAAEIQKLVTLRHQRFPFLFEHSLELSDVLQNNCTGQIVGAAGRQHIVETIRWRCIVKTRP